MNQKSTKQRAAILNCLAEGNSMRATARMQGVSINTVVKLLEDAGSAALDYQDRVLVNLNCKLIQCDEIWAFCYAKEKNVPAEMKGEFGVGDVWTWVALDADTKLVPCWCVGNRDAATAKDFMANLAGRLDNRVQLTTDGHRPYLQAVEDAFGMEIDYAMLVKLYGNEGGAVGPERKYSPGEVNGAVKYRVQGNPKKDDVSTSYVERQNLTMRMCMRRFTRLTNAFSKKVENHMHAVSLHFMYYNFCRKHQTLNGQTPAMAAGITDHPFTMEEVVETLLGSN